MREFVGRERTAIIDKRRRYVFKRQQLEQEYRPARLREGCKELNASHAYAKALGTYATALEGFRQICTNAEWNGKWSREYVRVDRWADRIWIPADEMIVPRSQLSLSL